MTLSEYIENLGDEPAARKLGISPRTAAAYRRHERIPRPAMARKLVKRSEGALSFDDCFRARAA